MCWRRLRPGELDQELVWLCVTVASAVAGILWLRSGLPTPRCTWHDLTGIPCLGCGSTRCVKYVLQGAWTAAFLINPMMFVVLMATAVYDLYAAIVLFGRLPRLRFKDEAWPDWVGWALRLGALALLMANWTWLIVNHV